MAVMVPHDRSVSVRRGVNDTTEIPIELAARWRPRIYVTSLTDKKSLTRTQIAGKEDDVLWPQDFSKTVSQLPGLIQRFTIYGTIQSG